jgi:hypothetical protein
VPVVTVEATTGAQAGLSDGSRRPATAIDRSNLSRRACDCLRRAGIDTLEQLAVLREQDLLRTGLWVGDVRKLVAALSREGLALREPAPSGPVRGQHVVTASGTTPESQDVGALHLERGSAITPLVVQAAEEPAPAPADLAPGAPAEPSSNPVDQRTAHLVALVEGGTTLEQAGAVYGIGRERVRQLLKEQGFATAQRIPLSPPPSSSTQLHTLGVTAEMLWRKGMRYRELALHLEIPQHTARELVCERIPPAERVKLIAEKLKCRSITNDEILAAIRDATEILGHPPAKPAYERLRGQGLIEGPDAGTVSHRLGWSKALKLAAHPN